MTGYERTTGFNPAPPAAGAQDVANTTISLLNRAQDQLYARVAQKRQRQGAEEGAAAPLGEDGLPALKEGSTIYAEAFNEAALNTYGSGLMVDIDNKLLEFQQQAQTDPEAFDTLVKGLSQGMLTQVPAQLKGPTKNYLTREAGRYRAKISQAQFAQEREAAVTQFGATLTHVENRIAAASRDGDDGMLAEMLLTRHELVNGAMSTGLLDEATALQMEEESNIRIEDSLLVGDFQRAYEAGQGVGFIREFIEKPPPGMAPERHEALQTRLLQDLRRRNSVEEENTINADKERTDRHRQGEQQLTLLALEGSLEPDLVRDYLKADRISPGQARTLEQYAYNRGPQYDDDLALLQVSSDLMSFTEEEIIAHPDLTNSTKLQLIGQRRSFAADQGQFVNTQSYREATRRIDGELGIQSGVLSRFQRADAVEAASRAKTELYEAIEAEVAEKGAISGRRIMELSEEIVGRIQTGNRQDELAAMERRLREAEASLPEMSGFERTDTERAMERMRTRIEEMKKELNGG